MSEEKKAELPPRVIVEFTTLGNEVVGFYLKKMELRGSWGMPEEYLSLSEHQSLLTAAEEKLRIAREALETAPSLIDDDYVTTETPDGEKENWINHGALKRHVDEALAKIGGADE